MKRQKNLFILLVLCLVAALSFTAFGCGETQDNPQQDNPSVETEYKIEFFNGETVLQTLNLKKGEMPKYTGETPTKVADVQYTYTFDGWDKAIVAVTGDAKYNAKFKSIVNKYVITFEKDGGSIKNAGEEIDTLSVDYGTTASGLTGLVVSKEGYAFVKFQIKDGDNYVDIPAGATVTENITLKPVYVKSYEEVGATLKVFLDGVEVTGENLTSYVIALNTALAEKTSYLEGETVDITEFASSIAPAMNVVNANDSTLSATVTEGAVAFEIRFDFNMPETFLGSGYTDYFTFTTGDPAWNENGIEVNSTTGDIHIYQEQGWNKPVGLEIKPSVLKSLYDNGYNVLNITYFGTKSVENKIGIICTDGEDSVATTYITSANLNVSLTESVVITLDMLDKHVVIGNTRPGTAFTITGISFEKLVPVTVTADFFKDEEQITGDDAIALLNGLAGEVNGKVHKEGDVIDVTEFAKGIAPDFCSLDIANSTLSATVTEGAVAFEIVYAEQNEINLIDGGYTKYFTAITGSYALNAINFDNENNRVILARPQGFDYDYGLFFKEDELQKLFNAGFNHISVDFYLDTLPDGGCWFSVIYGPTGNSYNVVQETKQTESGKTYNYTFDLTESYINNLRLTQYTCGSKTVITSVVISKAPV